MVSTATEAISLDKDAFMRLVTQERLKVEGPVQGCLYTGKQGRDGWEVYKTPATVWDHIPVQMGTIAQPALGADPAVVTVPAGKRWLLTDIYMVVGTSGAANWFPTFAVDDGTSGHNKWYENVTVTAATATYIKISNYTVRTGTGALQTLPMPPQDLPAGYAFRVGGTTADDRWSESYYFYKEVDA